MFQLGQQNKVTNIVGRVYNIGNLAFGAKCSAYLNKKFIELI